MELVKLIGPLILAFIMFSLGIGLTIENFKRVIVQPKDFIVGAISQIIILPISKKYNEYCIRLLNSLKNYDIRGHVDNRNETTGKKIRDAELRKVPFMVIIGEKEISEKVLSIREHGGNNLGAMTKEELIFLMKSKINNELEEK